MKEADKKPILHLIDALSEGALSDNIPKREEPAADGLLKNARGWLYESGIQGLGVGHKVTDSRSTGDPCLRVYVASKKPKARLGKAAPKFLPRLDDKGEMPVDVVEIGDLHLQDNPLRQRPLLPGLSVGHVSRTRGTLGLMVRSRHDPSAIYLLSCHHVIGPRPDEANSSIVRQPAPADGGTTSRDSIASYERSCPLHFSDEGFPPQNVGDAAIARLKPDLDWHNEIPFLGTPSGINDRPQLHDVARIFGAVSKRASGEILDPDFSVALTYPRGSSGRARAGFARQVLCTRYTEAGDSGAAVVDQAGRLMGIHVAGSERVSVFSPIAPIFDSLAVELIPEGADVIAPDTSPEDETGYVRPELTRRHNIFGSVHWRLTPRGLEVDGITKGTAGALVTVPRIWDAHRRALVDAAEEFEVPVELILACICTETRGDSSAMREEPGFVSDSATPHRVSAGLMQTLISTAREALGDHSIDRRWLTVPENSIRAGTAYIARQRQLTLYDPPRVACAYNSGGVYENRGRHNRWKMRQYPIGSGEHADRFTLWFNDVFRMFAQMSLTRITKHSFFKPLNS